MPLPGIADGPPVLLAFEPWSVAEALVAEVQGEPGWTRAEADAMRETWVLIGRRMVQLRGITEADWIAYVKDEFPSDLRAEWFAQPRCEECLNDEYGTAATTSTTGLQSPGLSRLCRRSPHLTGWRCGTPGARRCPMSNDLLNAAGVCRAGARLPLLSRAPSTHSLVVTGSGRQHRPGNGGPLVDIGTRREHRHPDRGSGGRARRRRQEGRRRMP